MIDPGFIDQINEEYIVQKNPGLAKALDKIQKQWAADLEAYQVLESRYRSMRDQLFALTNQMVHEANRIHDVREMRTK